MNRPGNENEHQVKKKIYKQKIKTNAAEHVELKKRKQNRTTERVCVIKMADCLSAWVSWFIHAQFTINIQIQYNTYIFVAYKRLRKQKKNKNNIFMN